jgi:DNA-binding NarL/FixJ family response regulator
MTHLTRREREIMHLICDGLVVKEIALHLHVSTHTVKEHLKNASKKLGARNGKHAVALFLESKC